MIASVIIPTCNRPGALEACLRSIVPQLTPDTELLICDDSRDGKTKNLLAEKFPAVAWHPGPRNGPGANRNVGANLARGRWLVFIDDDCVPRPGFLAGYLRAFDTLGADGNAALAGPIFSGPERETSLFWEGVWYAGQNDLPPACNFAIPRELFLKTGSFDERYRIAFEDIEFFSRLGMLGGHVRFVPDATIDHPCRQIPSSFVLARRWESRVMSSYDFGASVFQTLLRLPRHIALVILSRFHGYRWSAENVHAGYRFLGEFLWALWLLPSWIRKCRSAPPSPFWKARWGTDRVPAKYGL